MAYKKYIHLRIALLITFVALSIPAFGYVMNGFSYISNRWCFSVSLLVAGIFVISYDEIFERSKRLNIFLSIGVLGYGILTFIKGSNRMVKHEFVLLVTTIIVILALQSKWFRERKIIQKCILIVMVFVSLGFHGYAYYSPQFNGYVDEFLNNLLQPIKVLPPMHMN